MFRPQRTLIGMVHVGALPGTPAARDAIASLSRRAADEARLLADGGLDAVMIENMHDRPYLTRPGPEIIAAMTAIGLAVRNAVRVPLGIQVLAGANREALAVALACGAEFIRVEGFVYAHVADEGLMPAAAAGPLLRYRRQIAADGVAVFADIKKKHAAHALTADVDIAETARTAEFFGADGIVVTGPATAQPVAVSDLRAARAAVAIPVLVGSGVTPENLATLWPLADGFIVGSALKQDGHWSQPPDPHRIQRLTAVAAHCRRDQRSPGPE